MSQTKSKSTTKTGSTLTVTETKTKAQLESEFNALVEQYDARLKRFAVHTSSIKSWFEKAFQGDELMARVGEAILDRRVDKDKPSPQAFILEKNRKFFEHQEAKRKDFAETQPQKPQKKVTKDKFGNVLTNGKVGMFDKMSVLREGNHAHSMSRAIHGTVTKYNSRGVQFEASGKTGALIYDECTYERLPDGVSLLIRDMTDLDSVDEAMKYIIKFESKIQLDRALHVKGGMN